MVIINVKVMAIPKGGQGTEGDGADSIGEEGAGTEGSGMDRSPFSHHHGG